MRHNKKAFTLVEMLIAMAISTIIIAATYASYELVQKQYKKNIDVIQLHASGRAIMNLLEREVRMAGYEFRDSKGLMTYGTIIAPIIFTDSGNQCCDEMTIIYDEVFDTLNSQKVVTASTVERIQTRYWTEAFKSTNRGSRFRLYKRRTVLGTKNALLKTPLVGAKEVMADYIEDLQFNNEAGFANLYATDDNELHVFNTISRTYLKRIPLASRPDKNSSITIGSNGLIYGFLDFIGNRTPVEINPKSGQSSMFGLAIASSKRWSSGLGVAIDGNLYMNATAGKVDVYDKSTKKLIKTITPNKQIQNLVANNIDTNSNGVICEASKNSAVINCSNNSISLKGRTIYKSIEFCSDDILYAVGNGAGDDIDIFNLTTKKRMGEIPVNQSNKSYALACQSNIKTLSTVEIVLSLRTREGYGKDRTVKKQPYHAGNFDYTKTDNFHRDSFSSTISMRNL